MTVPKNTYFGCVVAQLPSFYIRAQQAGQWPEGETGWRKYYLLPFFIFLNFGTNFNITRRSC
jgi:hypothetical protein